MAASAQTVGCLLFAFAAACGGKSIDVSPDWEEGGSGSLAGSTGQGGSSQGGSAQGGSAQGGSAQAGGAQGGSVGYGGSGYAGTAQGGSVGGTGEGGTAGNACSQYFNQGNWYVRVQIINKASKTIYLGQETPSCVVNPNGTFTVSSADGKLLSPPNSCLTSCEMLVETGDFVGCPTICALPSTVTLKPGELFETTWNGLYGQQLTLPLECTAGSPYRDCERTLHVQPGNFTFSSLAGLDMDCPQSGDQPCNVCTPTPNGGCTTPGAVIGGQHLTATTKVYLDASYGVWGDASTAAGPTPGAGASAGTGAGAAPQPQAVQLVFTD